jgi:aryl-alcohol dehydrogenase-like predicted oxidoreductase
MFDIFRMTDLSYLPFGRSGLKVSELCLGTMTFGDDWGWGADKAESARIFDAFAAVGGNFVDTANNYTDGTSESLVGELVSRDRQRFVVATKYSVSVDADDPNAGGNHRKSLVRSLEQSLRRLRSDYVDLLWLHMRDPTTPIDEAMRALDDQVRAGKVLYVGISDSPAWLAAQAQTLADLRGWSPFIGLQVPYSIANRSAERELLPMAAAFGLDVAAWGALGHGVLTSKRPEERRWPDDAVAPRTQDVVDALKEVARDLEGDPAQVALAWLRARRAPRIVPIVGVRSEAQLRTNLHAVSLRLSEAQLARLDELSAPELGFPRAFLESDDVRTMIYGATRDRLLA